MALKVVPLPTQSFRTAAIGPRSNIRNGSFTIIHIDNSVTCWLLSQRCQGRFGSTHFADVGTYFVRSVHSNFGGQREC